MIKIVGAVLIFSVCAFTGIFISGRISGRLCLTEGFYLLCVHIKEQISCYRTPLTEIYSSFNNAALDNYGFCTLASKYGGKAALNKLKPELKLPDEVFSCLSEFFGRIGSGSCEEELRLCEFTCDKLSGILQKLTGEYSEKKKLARLLGFAVGIMLVLLLI